MGKTTVSKALECLLHKQDCGTCEWNPRPGATWPYGCVKGQSDIVHTAQEMLEEE